jgi:hypothetical protein
MYSLPSLGVAANYAASFRPPETVAGFSDVKSDIAAEYLMTLPQVQFEAEAELAKQALAERGATLRREMEVDYYKDRDARALKQSKAGALLSMLGAGSSGRGGGDGMGGSVDVLANSAARERQHNDFLASLQGRTKQGLGQAYAEVIKGIGGAPQVPARTGLEVTPRPPAVTYQSPAPDAMSSLANQLSLAERFNNSWKKGSSKS